MILAITEGVTIALISTAGAVAVASIPGWLSLAQARRNGAATATANERLVRVEQRSEQLVPNGGTSLSDRVDRIVTRADAVSERVDGLAAKLDQHQVDESRRTGHLARQFDELRTEVRQLTALTQGHIEAHQEGRA